MRASARRFACGLAAASWWLAFAAPSPAQNVGWRRFVAEHGLVATDVRSLAQDADGFLWAGTVGGIFRFDGAAFERVAPDIGGVVSQLASAPNGELVAVVEDGSAWSLRRGEDRARRLGAAANAPFTDVLDARFVGAELWLVRESGVWRREGGAKWLALPQAWSGESPRRVRPAADGAAYVLTREGLWVVARGAAPRRLAAADRLVDALDCGRRRLGVTFAGEVLDLGGLDLRGLDLGGETPRRLLSLAARGISLACAGDGVAWASFDRYLVRLPAIGPLRVMGPSHGVESGGGPLLVDHEGGLWLGGYTGLSQAPAPETEIWHDAHGLPSAHVRFLLRHGDSVVVVSWQGEGAIAPGPDGPRARSDLWPGVTRTRTCRVGALVLAPTEQGLLKVGSTGAPQADLDDVGGCAPRLGGGLWIASPTAGLHVVSPAGEVRRWPATPLAAPTGVLETANGLWIGGHERICSAPRPTAEGHAGWRCWSLTGVGEAVAFSDVGKGRVWAATTRGGMLVGDDESWSPLGANRQLPSRLLAGMRVSPRGGIWVFGHGVARRVEAEPASPAGWRVLETLTAWHGLPPQTVSDLIEDPDGTLWLATDRGVVRMPPASRDRPLVPPRVRIEHRVTQPGRAVELAVAALSYRDRSLVRSRYRLGAGQRWQEVPGAPRLRWPNLSPGSYRVEVQASLDGVRWSPVAASFAFSVPPPWYRAWWAIALYVAAALAALWIAHSLRTAHLVGLERQRTRIAMDLHDEVGSALAALGIEASVLAAAPLEPTEQRSLADRLARSTRDVGTELANVVWAMRRGESLSVQDLFVRLTDLGARLFPSGEATFEARPPAAFPAARLPAERARHLLALATEALHNAARHAAARHVVLTLEALPGGWRLAVEDDGVGLPADAMERGMGLTNLRRRAQTAQAQLEIDSRPGAGTRIAAIVPFASSGSGRWVAV